MDPSMSVKRKVTVPVGRLGKAASIGPGWAASNHRRRSAGASPAPRMEDRNQGTRGRGEDNRSFLRRGGSSPQELKLESLAFF